MSASAPTYAFRDSAAAAERVSVIARIFEESTRAFLAEVAGPPFSLALDLGCGPGHTTRIVADTLRATRTVGLDASPRFLALAAARAGEIEFLEHNVTVTPFPLGSADVAYCRFLLSHIAGPEDVLAGWATQLRRGGLLLLEEFEWIDSAEPVVERYYGVARELLAARGHVLEVGPVVAAARPAGLAVRSSRVVVIAADPRLAALAYLQNLRVWRDDPAVQARGNELRALEAELEALAEGDPAPIAWGMRQIVYEREAAGK
jgi:trans-aconitate 2-methyltransferase